MKKNITICIGIFIGDKDEHIYEDRTNEWGFGIEILDSKDITVNNVKIYALVGDGILITGDSFQANNNNNINEGIIELYSVNAEINNNSIINLDKIE